MAQPKFKKFEDVFVISINQYGPYEAFSGKIQDIKQIWDGSYQYIIKFERKDNKVALLNCIAFSENKLFSHNFESINEIVNFMNRAKYHELMSHIELTENRIGLIEKRINTSKKLLESKCLSDIYLSFFYEDDMFIGNNTYSMEFYEVFPKESSPEQKKKIQKDNKKYLSKYIEEQEELLNEVKHHLEELKDKAEVYMEFQANVIEQTSRPSL